MIAQMVAALNGVLPPDYVATNEVRCVISHSAREIVPDAALLEPRTSSAPPHSFGNTAVLDRPQSAMLAPDSFDAPLVLRVKPAEERQWFVNIIRVGGGKFQNAELVTTIEVLSTAPRK